MWTAVITVANTSKEGITKGKHLQTKAGIT